MKPLITVFTPTYNRDEYLKYAYESLLNQSMYNFVWLIVDDGSTDETHNLVKSWAVDSPFEIRYIYQENQGKHIAINTGVKNSEEEYFVILDSDDILMPWCMEEFISIIPQSKNEDIAAFVSFIAIDHICEENNEVKPIICYEKDFEFKTPYKRENFFCFKTEVLRSFPFPKFEGETFCPESLVFNRIAHKYKFLFYPKAMAKGKYLEGGLSSKYWNLLVANPRGSLLWLKEKIYFESDEHAIKNLVNNYWAIALKANNISWFEKIKGVPIYYTFNYFLKKVFKKKFQ